MKYSQCDVEVVVRACVACRSESFWNMCHPEICFRLTSCAVLKNVPFWNILPLNAVQTLSYVGQTTMMSFLLIVFEVALYLLLKNKQANKCSSLALLLVSLLKFLCFRTLHLTYGFDMTTLTQCQPEACFRMAHFSERQTIPIWNMFQDGTFSERHTMPNLKHVSGWHMFKNGTQHVLLHLFWYPHTHYIQSMY